MTAPGISSEPHSEVVESQHYQNEPNEDELEVDALSLDEASCRVVVAQHHQVAATSFTPKLDRRPPPGRFRRFCFFAKCLKKGPLLVGPSAAINNKSNQNSAVVKKYDQDDNISNCSMGDDSSLSLSCRQIIVNWCIDTIDAAEDCELKGVYVQNGKTSLVAYLETCFNRGDTPEKGEYDVKAVASFLKKQIRNLPEPLFPESLYQDLVVSCSAFAKTQSLEKLCETVKKLSSSNYQLAKTLFRHFFRLTKQRSLLLVTPVSLAIALTPSLFDIAKLANHLKDSDVAVYEASLAVAVRNFVAETIISQADLLFHDDKPSASPL